MRKETLWKPTSIHHLSSLFRRDVVPEHEFGGVVLRVSGDKNLPVQLQFLNMLLDIGKGLLQQLHGQATTVPSFDADLVEQLCGGSDVVDAL